MQYINFTIILICLTLTQREKQIQEIYAPRPQAYIDGKIHVLKPYKNYFIALGNKDEASLYVNNANELSKISEEAWIIRKKNLKSKEKLLKITKNLCHIYPLYEYNGNITCADGRVILKVEKEEINNIKLWLKDRKMPMDNNKDNKNIFTTFISDDPTIPNPFDLANQLRNKKGVIWAKPSLIIQKNFK